MSWLQVVVLSIVQGLTEFLPISSSGHLAIVSRVFFAGDAGASFTAVSQLGTDAALIVYFFRDIVRILKAWFDGLLVRAHRNNTDYRLGWYVIIGSIPIGVLGFLFKDAIRSEVRNLWVIATAMLVFSAVIAAAEYFGRQDRHIDQLTWRDGLLVGLAQCLALVPGVSRSGSTISAGLALGLDRPLAARFGFLLAIPAVFASG
ncbi:MAG: undecaprenyl-diphosphate phosphatase, partial [Mycobacterium sp.]